MKKRELFKVEGDKIVRLRRNCPKCGDGVFLAEHKNRLSCGNCGYTEFKGKKTVNPKEIPTEKPAEAKQEETVIKATEVSPEKSPEQVEKAPETPVEQKKEEEPVEKPVDEEKSTGKNVEQQ